MIRFLLDHGASVDATTKVSDALFTLHSRLYNPLYDRSYNRLDELCNERRLSGPARTIITSLRRCAQQGGCVDSRRCGVFDRNLKEEFLFIYFTIGSIWSWRWQKLDQLQNSTKLYLFIYLFILINEYLKRFVLLVPQPVVQSAVRMSTFYKPLYNWTGWKVYTDLDSVLYPHFYVQRHTYTFVFRGYSSSFLLSV